MKKSFTIISKEALIPAATEIIKIIASDIKTERGASILALTGDLGAGKTTFVQTLARDLGVSESVPSPTFNIYRSYVLENQPWSKLVHMDAYRIESLAELKPLRFSEIISDRFTLLCLEWPEKIAQALPSHWNLTFQIINETERQLTLIKEEGAVRL